MSMRPNKPPLKGLAGVAVLDGVQLLNAKLRTAQLRRRGFRRYAEYHLKCTKANSYQPLAAPFGGGAPRSGKGGAVGSFEPLPSNEQHPLSQAVRPARSPIGEPSFPCCPRWGKCRAAAKGVPLVFLSCYHSTNHTPLRLAKNRLTAVARLHGACGRTSQALWACQLPFQGR